MNLSLSTLSSSLLLPPPVPVPVPVPAHNPDPNAPLAPTVSASPPDYGGSSATGCTANHHGLVLNPSDVPPPNLLHLGLSSPSGTTSCQASAPHCIRCHRDANPVDIDGLSHYTPVLALLNRLPLPTLPGQRCHRCLTPPHATPTPATTTTGLASSPAILVSPPDSRKSPNLEPNCNLARVRKEDNLSFLDWAEKID